MPPLHKREKVLVQYRLLKDFDEIARRGIPGIDVRVLEDNIYEWHVTMSPLSGHFSGLRLHLILLFPEDYPRQPPKVELCTQLPHANVFADFLTFRGYWAGYQPVRGTYAICTNLLESKPPPVDPSDTSRYDGWSVAYSVESVLVQLQCLLFDDYVLQDDGHCINTLWDRWYHSPADPGRKSKRQVCVDLHKAQTEADDFVCRACGYSGMDGRVAFYNRMKDGPQREEDADEEVDEGDEAEEDDGEERDEGDEDKEDVATQNDHSKLEDKAARNPKFASRKKQRKMALQKAKDGIPSTKIDFKEQRLYMEIANSNSALVHGWALRRVPGVFKPRDVVTFKFHGVEDEAYVNGRRCINNDLQIFNYGHEVEFPWCTFDILTGRKIYHKVEPEEKEGEKKEKNKGKADWEKFVNSQGGGSKKKPEDTPGTKEFVRRHEKSYPVGVVEFVDPWQGTVTIVVAGSDGRLGASGGHVTDQGGPYAWNSESSKGGEKAVLFKNVPMEKVKLHGYETEVVPYEHEPQVNYRPIAGKYADDERLEYDLEKDMPVRLVNLLEAGAGEGLTRQTLAMLPTLPEDMPPMPEASLGPASVSQGASSSCRWAVIDGRTTEQSFQMVDGRATEQSFEVVDGQATEGSFDVVGGLATEHSFELVSALGDELVSALGDSSSSSFEALFSSDSGSSSFDIISVAEEGQSRSSDGSGRQVSHPASSHGSGFWSSVASSTFHLVPTELSHELFYRFDAEASAVTGGAAGLSVLSAGDGASGAQGQSDAWSVISSRVSERSLLSLRSVVWPSARSGSDAAKGWEFLKVLGKLNVPIRALRTSVQGFGAFLSIDSTPRNLRLRNERMIPANKVKPSKGKGGKGKAKGTGGAEKIFQEGLLPWLPYMKAAWPPAKADKSRTSVMVSSNVLDDLSKEEDPLTGAPEMVVYVNEVDTERHRLKLSLQPRLSFEQLRLGEEYIGIVTDVSRQSTLGLFVAISDNLVGLLHKSQLGAGEFADYADDGQSWPKRAVYRVGDRVTVWLVRKEDKGDAEGPKRRYKLDFTMESGSAEMRQHQIKRFFQVLQAEASDSHPAGAAPANSTGKTMMQQQLEQTYDQEDKFFLIKNNRLIREAEQAYPDLVIDYNTDPPPPPPAEAKERSFDFSLIEGWTVARIAEEHKRLADKRLAHNKPDPKQVKPAKPLSPGEAKLLAVLEKKVEQWGTEYYDKIAKKVEDHQKRIREIYEAIKAERDKYPHRSIIDLDKFRELSERVKEKAYDNRSCFVTRLSYKEDVLGVGLEIKPEPGTDRNVFYCSFDLISKEGFKDFGVKTGVWKDRIQFWMPAAIDASHFRRALPYLADCFKELGEGHIEKLTRSYGTQAGSAKYNLKAQLREAEREGKKIMSLDDYRKAEAKRKQKLSLPSPSPSERDPSEGAPSEHDHEALPPRAFGASLTEEDVAYGLEVLPKLMNLQTVQLMKGDLHLSTKALEGYMGFHHLLLSILRQFPSLQAQVESKVAAFLKDEGRRSKKACPNIGEFLCLLAVSQRYTWDDVSTAVLKETLDRNASWAIDKFPVLAKPGISAEVRLEKTFRASIVSIRLLCFNVWFLRNIVFKKYGEDSTVESIVADKLSGAPPRHCVDRRWEEYEERKGIPKPYEVDLLQEQMRRMMHGEGLNSWTDYFISLNVKPLAGKELSQLLRLSLSDAVEKGYIPVWKMRALMQPKAPKEKAPANDYMGADADKYELR